MNEEFRKRLTIGLPLVEADTGCLEQLSTFSTLLVEKNKVMNLTGITEPEEIATLHLLDSLALYPALGEARTLVDVGTGAGFPGMPLAIAHPALEITLLDSLNKRIDFLKEVSAAIGRTDITCVHGRAEEFAADHREQFDAATSRAVANLSMLSELCLPLVKPGGLFIAMKSTDTEEELNAAKGAIRLLGGKVESVLDYTIPCTMITHRLILIRKVAETPKKYPRRFAQMKKQPL